MVKGKVMVYSLTSKLKGIRIRFQILPLLSIGLLYVDCKPSKLLKKKLLVEWSLGPFTRIVNTALTGTFFCS